MTEYEIENRIYFYSTKPQEIYKITYDYKDDTTETTTEEWTKLLIE